MESLFTNDSVSVLSNAESLPTEINVWSVASLSLSLSLSLFKILKKKTAHNLLYLPFLVPNVLYKIEVLESMGSCPVAVALQPWLRIKECVS